MSNLRVIQPADDAELADWRHVHNVIIPTDPLSPDDVRDRAGRYHLEVAYLGDTPVGCSTVRPPCEETPAATVIARVLPGHRGRGFGTELYLRGLARAREFGGEGVETVVLASNESGLRFALRHGFTETERYLLPGDTVPYVALTLNA
ncbi:GNAT family N-acetyltransferase [Kitasatospora sp. NPDC048365]|uniref:GNAT family N-acetyltransferase n=1 Tax=Kitasatospora sp. NPDC048365 TaxID=3364050 RepID=UPI0037126C18